MRLLHQADIEAFPRWRFFFPTLIHGALISGNVAIAQALTKVVWLSGSAWAKEAMMVLFVFFGIWLARLWEARRIRPFLRLHVEMSGHVVRK